MIIERVSADSPEAVQLMAELWAELDQLYGNETPTVLALTRMDTAGASFVIARRDGQPVGCGALRPLFGGIAEVKRVYVRPGERRSGVARAIMHELEQLARAAGFNEIWLETGLPQAGALRLYESLGYTRIAGFGEYMDDPANVCFGKRLT